MSLWFGLDSYQLHQTCPNQLTIRTRFTSVTPNLSESAHHSDSFHISYTKPVRIRAPFGLDSYQFHQTCPNRSTIRTRFLSIPPNLSESGHHSDSILINSTKPVRIRAPFGLVPHQFHQSCPNQLTIRTRFPIDSSYLSKMVPSRYK